MSNFFPGLVTKYDAIERICMVTIPGFTDEPIPAEILYPLGEKATSTKGAVTEIEIFPGDKVWLQFIGGDVRYPLIVGYRHALKGNTVDWRQWHHKNIGLWADVQMHIDSKGIVTINGADSVTVNTKDAKINATGGAEITSPSVKINAGATSCSGSLSVGGALNVSGGASISGGSGATFSGNMRVNGQISASGSIRENS